MIVGVLALDQVMGFELMIPGQVFGMANLAAAEPGAASNRGAAVVLPKYEVRVPAGAAPIDQYVRRLGFGRDSHVLQDGRPRGSGPYRGTGNASLLGRA